MRKSFIVEKNNIKEDFIESLKELKQLMKNGDEGDILFENGNGTFSQLVQGCFAFNSESSKYEQEFWFNQNLIHKLGIKNKDVVF